MMRMVSNHYHIPVLLKACIDSLQIKPDGVYVDLTFGGGGHSKEILKQLGKNGKLISFDQDEDAAGNVPEDERMLFVQQNFRHLKSYLRLNGVTKVDGILGDLGVSSHQFDEADRGFSIRFNARLDMRMNRQSPLTAEEIVNGYAERDLMRIFREYGEVPNTGRLVKAIVAAREAGRITTTDELKEAILGV